MFHIQLKIKIKLTRCTYIDETSIDKDENVRKFREKSHDVQVTDDQYSSMFMKKFHYDNVVNMT
jgi:hypothetical protein